MKSVQASFKLTLHIQPQAGTTSISVPLASADMMYVPNGKNTAVVQLPVGFYTSASPLPNGRFSEVFVPNSLLFHRGDWAWITIDIADDSLTSGGVVFSGYIYDYGPAALQFGTFAITVTLFGTINFLGTGTLQTSSMVPASYLSDNEHWLSQFTLQANQYTTDNLPPQFVPSNVINNTFGAELLRVLKGIASGTGTPLDGVSQQMINYLGSNPNTLALALLGSTDASRLNFRTFISQQAQSTSPNEKTAFIAGIVNQINLRFNSNWKYMSFLDRIIELGNDMFFSIIEVGNQNSFSNGSVQFQPGLGYNAVLAGGAGLNPFSQILLVPSNPFFNSSAAIHINPDTYSGVQQAQDPSGILRDFKAAFLLPCVGTVLSQNGANQNIIGFFDGTKQQSSQFIQFNGSSNPDLLGQVIVAPVNPLFVEGSWTGATTSSPNGVAQPGYLSNVSPDFLGNTLAMMAYFNAKYAGRTMFVTSPFLRADIAPLTPLRLNLPATHEIAAGLESAVVYGQCRSVTISLNATHATAQTRIEIGYIRTQYDQETYVDPNFPSSQQDGANPLWATNWNGCTLTGIPYNTPQSFVSGGEFLGGT